MINFKKVIESHEYNFLRSDEHLNKHIILLGMAGSYSYGTNNENSDIDIRGISLNRKSDLIGMTQYEQYVDDNTDTTIYAFNKAIRLFMNCNPNTIELLGLNPEHYLYLNDIGKSLIANKDMFLSKRAIQSFGGYADAQLRRLQNALARESYPQSEKETHILNSIRNAMFDFNRRYHSFESGKFQLYTDKSENPQLETEIFMDVDLKHYPLRDYKNVWAEMNNIVKDYETAGKRNRKKDDNHLNKHAMHLLRLFMMAIDILEKSEIKTFREKEHDLLMEIRSGGYQNDDGSFSKEFYELISEYEKKLESAANSTKLPDNPDFETIQKFVMSINEKVVNDEI